MVKKEIISYKEGLKAKQYYPNINRDDAAVAETESLIDRVYQGSVSMMLSTLVRSRHLSENDIKELYQILEESEGKS